MSRLISRRTLLVSGSMAIGGLALGACAGSDEPSSGAGGGQGAATLGQTTDPNFPQIPLLLANEQNSFAEAGLEVRSSGLRTAGMPAALLSDSVDFVYTSVSGTVLEMRNQGQDVICIAKATFGNPNIVLMRKAFADERGVSEKSPIADRLEALRGARWAATSPGTATDITVQNIMSQADMKLNTDYTITYLQEISAFIAAVQQGQIDAYAVFSPIGEQSVADGNSIKYIGLPDGEIPAMKDMTWSSLWGKRTVIEEDPEAAKGMVRGLWKSLQYLQTNPDEAKAQLRDSAFKELSDEAFEMSWTNNAPIFPADPHIETADFEKALALHNYGKSDDKQLKDAPDEIFTNEYVDAIAGEFT